MRTKIITLPSNELENSNDNIVATMTTGKVTDYILNDDKAKKQLLKSDKRQKVEFSKQTKTSTKFAMCTGTYKEVIFPVIEEWSRAVSENVCVRLNSSPGWISSSNLWGMISNPHINLLSL